MTTRHRASATSPSPGRGDRLTSTDASRGRYKPAHPDADDREAVEPHVPVVQVGGELDARPDRASGRCVPPAFVEWYVARHHPPGRHPGLRRDVVELERMRAATPTSARPPEGHPEGPLFARARRPRSRRRRRLRGHPRSRRLAPPTRLNPGSSTGPTTSSSVRQRPRRQAEGRGNCTVLARFVKEPPLWHGLTATRGHPREEWPGAASPRSSRALVAHDSATVHEREGRPPVVKHDLEEFASSSAVGPWRGASPSSTSTGDVRARLGTAPTEGEQTVRPVPERRPKASRKAGGRPRRIPRPDRHCSNTSPLRPLRPGDDRGERRGVS